MRIQRRGFVLIAVLWVMVGVSALGFGTALIARRAVDEVRNRIALRRLLLLSLDSMRANPQVRKPVRTNQRNREQLSPVLKRPRMSQRNPPGENL